MIAETDMKEYLDEIRLEVCSRCVERPYGGPPCGPLGKPCGVELHLPQLVEAVRQVHSNAMDPYLDASRRDVCTTCPFLHSQHCPCPMDSLAVLVVGAIETVDERRKQRAPNSESTPDQSTLERFDLAEVDRLYHEAAGTWTGCDWFTSFGPAKLNLEGWTAEQATAHAVKVEPPARQDWEAAAHWLMEVERRAADAQAAAMHAARAARAGAWREAVDCARRAWALEFSTGRTFRRPESTWKPLFEALKVGALAHFEPDAATEHRFGIMTLCDS